jgi:hypothetical protein
MLILVKTFGAKLIPTVSNMVYPLIVRPTIVRKVACGYMSKCD